MPFAEHPPVMPPFQPPPFPVMPDHPLNDMFPQQAPAPDDPELGRRLVAMITIGIKLTFITGNRF
jgi:hypothetical protein